jgi:hypothetical protein
MSFWLIDDQFFIIVGFWAMLIIFVAVFRIAVMEEPRPPFPLSVLLEAATRLGGRWLATPLQHAACAPASGNCQRIDSPSSGDHGVLEVGHEPPGGSHVAGARPRSSGEVSGKDMLGQPDPECSVNTRLFEAHACARVMKRTRMLQSSLENGRSVTLTVLKRSS